MRSKPLISFLALAVAGLLLVIVEPAKAFHVNVGDILVTDWDQTWNVVKIDRVTGARTVFGQFMHPMDVALHPSGILYIGEYYGDIQMLNVATETITPMTLSGDLPSSIWGLTLTSDGLLYVTGRNADGIDAVFKVIPETGVSTILTQGNLLLGVGGVELLNSTHLVVASALNNRLVSVALANGSQATIVSGGDLDQPYDVAVLGTTLYTGALDSKWLLKVSGSTVSHLADLPGWPWGMDVDPDGSLAVGVRGVAGEVLLIAPDGTRLASFSGPEFDWAAGLEIARTAIAPIFQAPVIVTQPESQTVTEGSSATFTVVATGSPPLAYQWRFNNQPIPGATGSTLILAKVQDAHAGVYSVVVSNGSTVTSANASLTLNHRPVPATPVLERSPSLGAKRRVADFLGIDPDGDTLVLTSLGPTSAKGGSVGIVGDWVAYTPPPNLTTGDSFNFTVSDGRGGSATGSATVALRAELGLTENLIAEPAGGNHMRLRGDGIPGFTYSLEFSESLSPPNWLPLELIVADPAGAFEHVDRPPAGAAPRFYRAVGP
jgi:hypothetical protein